MLLTPSELMLTSFLLSYQVEERPPCWSPVLSCMTLCVCIDVHVWEKSMHVYERWTMGC